MQLFKTPLDKARASHANLSQRLETARAAVTEHKIAAQKAARDDANDATLDKVEDKLRAALIRVDTFASALAETTAEITKLEQEQLEAADKAQRQETATAFENMGRDLTKAADDFMLAASALATVTGRISVNVPDAVGLATFAASATTETPATIGMVKNVLQWHAAETLAGRRRATLLQPTPPAPRQASAPVPVTRLFAIRDIAWTDASGKLCTAPRWSDVDLPQGEVAQRARRLKAAVPMNDPMRRKQRGFGKQHKPARETCVDLDHDGQTISDPRVTPPTQHTAFEPLPTRAPYIVKTPRGEAMPATRNLKEP